MASRMGDIAGPKRVFPMVFSTFFAIDDASFDAMFQYVPHVVSPLGPTWREAVAKRCQAAACYRHDSSFHVHQRASIWNPSGSLWAQPQPNMTQWHQLGLPHRHLGPIGPLWEQPGAKLSPTRANSADSMQHAESVHFYRYFQRFLGFV